MDPIHGRPHRRYNPLAGSWVLVSPHRTERPWQGATERPAGEGRPAYDPGCYLCPGNARAGGARTPAYGTTFVFDNDFPALLEPGGGEPVDPAGAGAGELLNARPEAGVCRVICFSPRHDLTLARMEASAVRGVVDVWEEQYRALGTLPFVGHVQIFENKGAMMGCSNPHPHGQIWATESIPNEPAREIAHLIEWQGRRGRCLLCEYGQTEDAREERVVCANRHFLALVPFWAVWPFEILVLARRHAGSLAALDGAERDALADILRRVAVRYDNLFETPFPYSMGLHQSPTDGAAHAECHLHAHFYPPLLRSATVKKFMVGYEMLGEAQRDITPEQAAERLRALSEDHHADSTGCGG